MFSYLISFLFSNTFFMSTKWVCFHSLQCDSLCENLDFLFVTMIDWWLMFSELCCVKLSSFVALSDIVFRRYGIFGQITTFTLPHVHRIHTRGVWLLTQDNGSLSLALLMCYLITVLCAKKSFKKLLGVSFGTILLFF